MTICTVDGCRRPQHSSGYCGRHYQRLRQYGDLDRTSDLAYGLSERFWRHVLLEDVLGGGCWTWRGSTWRGYGVMSGTTTGGRGTTVRAHRFAYELMVGPIRSGLTIDHLCRNRACVNPTHMEPVTVGENVRRALTGIRRGTCKRGHAIDYSNGRRGYCRACRNAAQRQRRATNGRTDRTRQLLRQSDRSEKGQSEPR